MAKTKIKKGNMLGAWTFLIGVGLAIILGAFGTLTPLIVLILVIAGLVIGLLNVTDEEAQPFMISGTVLILAGALGQGAVDIIPALSRVLGALLIIFVPATIIVAIKNVFSLARN